MTAPVWLIAERELRAYVMTASFWIALAVAPLVMAITLLAGSSLAPHSASGVLAIEASDPALARTAKAAVAEAARLDGRPVRIVAPGSAPALVVRATLPDSLTVRWIGRPPLSPAAALLVERTLERDRALGKLARDAQIAEPSPAAVPRDQLLGAGRFGLVMMLWLTLTGSLGMLLQAVVRERANNGLEALLAAARPADVVFGKLLGIGAVSILVLTAWLATGAALSPMAPGAGGLAGATLKPLGDPAVLGWALGLYVLAFAFYGLVTIGVGAQARDTAQAQNLSRPVFAVLLAAFFSALACAAGAPGLGWMVYVPVFSPFLLLMRSPGALPPGAELLSVGLLVAAAAAAAWWAIRAVARAVDRNAPVHVAFGRPGLQFFAE
jgi:ABC-type Na+ efflux pump permease subunit